MREYDDKQLSEVELELSAKSSAGSWVKLWQNTQWY